MRIIKISEKESVAIPEAIVRKNQSFYKHTAFKFVVLNDIEFQRAKVSGIDPEAIDLCPEDSPDRSAAEGYIPRCGRHSDAAWIVEEWHRQREEDLHNKPIFESRKEEDRTPLIQQKYQDLMERLKMSEPHLVCFRTRDYGRPHLPPSSFFLIIDGKIVNSLDHL